MEEHFRQNNGVGWTQEDTDRWEISQEARDEVNETLLPEITSDEAEEAEAEFYHDLEMEQYNR